MEITHLAKSSPYHAPQAATACSQEKSLLDAVQRTKAHCASPIHLGDLTHIPEGPNKAEQQHRPQACSHNICVMAKFERHIFICTNQRSPDNPRGCCDPAALGTLQLAFKKELAARGLKERVRANRAGCLDQCEHGPTVVIYPEAVWYGGVQPEDVTEIIEAHIIGNTTVKRLQLRDECINTTVCEHKSVGSRQ